MDVQRCRSAKEEYRSDSRVVAGLTRWVEVIGEAARNISPPTRDRAPAIPWGQIVGARHVLVHEYFRVDLDVLWQIVRNDLPPLVAAIEALLESPPAPNT